MTPRTNISPSTDLIFRKISGLASESILTSASGRHAWTARTASTLLGMATVPGAMCLTLLGRASRPLSSNPLSIGSSHQRNSHSPLFANTQRTSVSCQTATFASQHRSQCHLSFRGFQRKLGNDEIHAQLRLGQVLPNFGTDRTANRAPVAATAGGNLAPTPCRTAISDCIVLLIVGKKSPLPKLGNGSTPRIQALSSIGR